MAYRPFQLGIRDSAGPFTAPCIVPAIFNTNLVRLVIPNQLEDSRLKLVEYAHTGVIADRRAYVGKWLGSGTTPIGAIRRRCGRRSQHLKQIVIVQVAASIIASRDEGA
jgi:hypothetical protein